jgi:hypothetical protein
VSREIRRALDQAGIATNPDFEYTWIDHPLRFFSLDRLLIPLTTRWAFE